MGTPSYWAWRSKLFHRDRFDWEPNRGSIQKITEAVAEDAYVLSRNAVGIGSKKVRETRTIPMTSRQKRAYKLARDSFELDYEGRREETQWVLTKLIWMHRLAGGFHPFGSCVNPGKIDELVKLLQGELANEPVVVWFRYLQEIEAVARRLRKLHLPHGCITGATPLATRDAVAEGLQSGRLRAILVQLKCGRYGMNFSRSDTAIYFSSSYESEDRLQSEDRIIHPTKKTPALILDLVTEGSMDQAILSVLQMKRASSRATLRAIAQEVLNG
jgi:SNF2 family DNA or RNA helicase